MVILDREITCYYQVLDDIFFLGGGELHRHHCGAAEAHVTGFCQLRLVYYFHFLCFLLLQPTEILLFGMF
jgi:hypothetical protein